MQGLVATERSVRRRQALRLPARRATPTRTCHLLDGRPHVEDAGGGPTTPWVTRRFIGNFTYELCGSPSRTKEITYRPSQHAARRVAAAEPNAELIMREELPRLANVRPPSSRLRLRSTSTVGADLVLSRRGARN